MVALDGQCDTPVSGGNQLDEHCVASEHVEHCAMCSKELSASGNVTLVSADGTRTSFCCAHCALVYATRAAADGATFSAMRGQDHETGEPLDLTNAFFVYDSSIVTCCGPSILATADRATAEGYNCRFDPRPVRYIRVTQPTNSANTGRHLVEVAAFAE